MPRRSYFLRPLRETILSFINSLRNNMTTSKPRILAISGSLRTTSSNSAILRIVAGMLPGIDFIIYNGVGDLPHFNDSQETPPLVEDFRQQLGAAHAVFICTPEYAFGVPGSLKNALDWTVGTGDFVDKPVALVTASSAGDKAHAALLYTLTAISADLADDRILLISFIRAKMKDGEITDQATYDAIKTVLVNLVKSAETK
jgi:chromate reductase, NAD(P)H dehydrogenase (quinone)